MSRFTVIWSRSAKRRLAELWLDNPAIRPEITEAADQLDRALARVPSTIGIPVSPRSRLVVHPPLSALYWISEGDMQVRVIYVSFWDDLR
jgi:hypothetical protein